MQHLFFKRFYRVAVYLFVATQFVTPLYYARALDRLSDALAQGSGFDPSSLPPLTASDVAPRVSNDPISFPEPLPPETYNLGFIGRPWDCSAGCTSGDPVSYVAFDEPPGIQVRRRSNGPAQDDMMLSPDGNIAAYSTQSGGTSSIQVSDVDGRNLQTITPTGTNAIRF